MGERNIKHSHQDIFVFIPPWLKNRIMRLTIVHANRINKLLYNSIILEFCPDLNILKLFYD